MVADPTFVKLGTDRVTVGMVTNKRTIIGFLRQSLVPDSGTSARAFTALKWGSKGIGFAPILLEILRDESLDMPLRQASSIYFKNFICMNWIDNNNNLHTPSGANSRVFIHEQDKVLIKNSLIATIVDVPEEIRLQLAVCVQVIVKTDLPDCWIAIIESICAYLCTQDSRCWSGVLLALYQLMKSPELKLKSFRNHDNVLGELVPLLYKVFANCLTSATQEAAEIRKLILKIFYALVKNVLPLHILTQSTFSNWMEAINAVVLLPIPHSVAAVEPEELSRVIWWKEKKWAMRIFAHIFKQYGSPGKVRREYKDFCEWYIRTFSSGMFNLILMMFGKYQMGIYISPGVIQELISYVNTGVSHALTWKIIKPNLANIFEGIIFPLMSYTKEDAELWDTDPYEYIRVKFDAQEDFKSPVTAAQDLLHSLCRKRKDALTQTMEYSLRVLQNSRASASQHDGALHMIGTMADLLKKKNQYKDSIEDFLDQVVFPVFTSPHGYLRARACWMLQNFADVKYKNEKVLSKALSLAIQTFLEDKEVPVRVEAGFVIKILLSSQDSFAIKFVEPQIEDIVTVLLHIIEDAQNTDIYSLLRKIVCIYTDRLIPRAERICRQLVVLLRKVLQANEKEKIFTAMGLLSSMETVICAMKYKLPVNFVLEPTILEAVAFIFKNCISELYEEALSLCSGLTATSISPAMWNMLALVLHIFKRNAVDYFVEMMPLLHNYVMVDNDTFLSNPRFPKTILSMCERILEDALEDHQCCAAKLLEVIILRGKVKKNIDDLIQPFVRIVLLRLSREIFTSELRTMCLQVAIAAMCYDHTLFFQVLSESQSLMPHIDCPLSKHFIEIWLYDVDCFFGLHDRKLCILGICHLIQLDPGRIVGLVENADRFIPSLIMLFRGLSRVTKNCREANESGDQESLDEDILDSDEDEVENDSLNNDSSVDDIYDEDEKETALEKFTTYIDGESSGVDEYEVFKVVIEQIMRGATTWHSQLVRGLSQEDEEYIQEILTSCARRQAARESKKIENQGGYKFANKAVPEHFNFTSPGGTPQQ